jgi:hypothetical protein
MVPTIGEITELKPKKGIVALLDALGLRTATIESAEAYLLSVEKIKVAIQRDIKITLVDKELIDKPALRNMFANLKPRFFGDTILFTYAITDEKLFNEHFLRMAFVLNMLMRMAVDTGILFRGAVSIGKYIETEDIVLGPAIVDAASWYDKLELFGIITTPAALNYVKAVYAKELLHGSFIESEPTGSLFRLRGVPIKGDRILNTYIFDWPTFIPYFTKGGIKDSLAWYYDRIRYLNVPESDERKYANTETFVKESIIRETKSIEKRKSDKQHS